MSTYYFPGIGPCTFDFRILFTSSLSVILGKVRTIDGDIAGLRSAAETGFEVAFSINTLTATPSKLAGVLNDARDVQGFALGVIEDAVTGFLDLLGFDVSGAINGLLSDLLAPLAPVLDIVDQLEATLVAAVPPSGICWARCWTRSGRRRARWAN